MDKNSVKTILFLDANESVVASILYAKSKGYRVITCDNIPTHVGHKYADKAYNISTYDIENLEKIAQIESINGVVYFCSAHGLYGAVRLISKLKLPGIPYEVEHLFSNKGIFRQFLKENKIANPYFEIFSNIENLNYKGCYPCIVKPVDSSGGNIGVCKVTRYEDLSNAVFNAIEVSYSKQALVEDYIESKKQVNGDCLVLNSQIVYLFAGKHLYMNNAAIVPFATVFGRDIFTEDEYRKIKDIVQKLISSSGIQNGVLNFEIRISDEGSLYFIEINPRHSGNKIYKLMNLAFDVSMEQIAVDLSLGNLLKFDVQNYFDGYYAYGIIYSNISGVLKNVVISDYLKKYIIEQEYFVSIGDPISTFTLLKHRIGILLLKFDDKDEMLKIVQNLSSYYQVKIQ